MFLVLTKFGFIWYLFISENNENASFKFLLSTQTCEAKEHEISHLGKIKLRKPQKCS